MLSNAYFLANIRFDTAENEPAKICKILQNKKQAQVNLSPHPWKKPSMHQTSRIVGQQKFSPFSRTTPDGRDYRSTLSVV